MLNQFDAIGILDERVLQRRVIAGFVFDHLPEPEIKATATSSHSRELIEARLSQDILLREREYLNDLLSRKYHAMK